MAIRSLPVGEVGLPATQMRAGTRAETECLAE